LQVEDGHPHREAVGERRVLEAVGEERVDVAWRAAPVGDNLTVHNFGRGQCPCFQSPIRLGAEEPLQQSVERHPEPTVPAPGGSGDKVRPSLQRAFPQACRTHAKSARASSRRRACAPGQRQRDSPRSGAARRRRPQRRSRRPAGSRRAARRRRVCSPGRRRGALCTAAPPTACAGAPARSARRAAPARARATVAAAAARRGRAVRGARGRRACGGCGPRGCRRARAGRRGTASAARGRSRAAAAGARGGT